MKKKKKIIKIIMVLIMIFYQLSPAATVLADELEEPINNQNEEINLENEQNNLEELENSEQLENEEENNEEIIPEELNTLTDDYFNEIYDLEIYFADGYIVTFAKGYYGNNNIPTVEYLAGALPEGITLNVKNGEDVITTGEIKNGYQVVFTDNNNIDNEAIYKVIVRGDNNLDNEFDENDVKALLSDYLNENKVLSMDIVASLFQEEEFGTITFEDVAIFNDVLNRHENIIDNTDLDLLLESDYEEVYVGDTVNFTVTIDSSDLADFIDGIEGEISGTNLELTDVKFDENLFGSYNEDGKFIGIGKPLYDKDIVVTIVMTAVSVGTGSVSVDGNIAKFLDLEEFSLSKEISILEKEYYSNNLESLNANVGEFDVSFDKDITEYTLTVPYDTESVILYGSLEDINASVEGLIEYALNEEETVATIVVTAVDGTIKTYTVTIVKESEPVQELENIATPVSYYYYYSSNSNLKSLEISDYDIVFDKEIHEYKITVSSDVNSLDIKALAEDSNARVEITGNEKFKTGENVVLITVTAEDGSTSIYKLIVNKKAPEKKTLSETEDSSNTTEKVIIIILIILVVLGLLYLIFKKDEEEEISVKKEDKKNDNKEIKHEKSESKEVIKNNNYNKQNTKKKK